MLGQVISVEHKKYNLIILAGGAGSRMGQASDYIPKALTKIGSLRSIDYIIERYKLVTKNIIIGTAFHSDLLMSYIRGNYANAEFSIEAPHELKNNAVSAAYCLDYADSRYGTIITFCDLIMMGNMVLKDNTLFYVTQNTKGWTGTFRHSLVRTEIIKNEAPVKDGNGLLGTFVLSDTPALKAITYKNFYNLTDLTDDIVCEYEKTQKMRSEECEAVYEFGTQGDLEKVRELWENA